MARLKEHYQEEISKLEFTSLEPSDEMYMTQDELDAREIDDAIKEQKELNLLYQMEHEHDRH